MSLADFPYEVWFNVFRFLPQETVFTVQDLSNTFKRLAFTFRYKTVRISAYNKPTKQLVKDLRDQDIAKTVKTVHVRPWNETASRKAIHTGWRRRFWSTWRSFNMFINPEFYQLESEKYVQRRLGKHVNFIVQSLRSLPNVVRYKLDWDVNANIMYPNLYTPFLATLLQNSMFGNNLVQLHLKVPPDKLCLLAPVCLPSLRELEVHFSTGYVSTEQLDQLFVGFITFVNNLDRSLTLLSVYSNSSSVCLDLTTFFDRLGTFPHLRSISLTMPGNGAHLSNLCVFRKFLNKHAQRLAHIQLGVSCFGVPQSLRVPPVWGRFWVHHLVDSLSTVSRPLPSLSSLAVALHPARGDIMPVRSCLGRLADHLETLRLTDTDLTLQEVKDIVQSLMGATRMKKLSLCVRCLSPELIDFLAESIPHLKALELTFKDVVHAEGAEVWYRKRALDLFHEAMVAKKYNTWEVARMAVPECPVPSLKWVPKLAPIFHEAIPALQDFEEIVDPSEA